MQTEQSNQPDYNQSGATDQENAPVDIYGMPDNELVQPSRKTRSGRVYAITSYALPKPILRYTTQDKNCQTDAPNPDFAQIKASARAHNSSKLKGLFSLPGHLSTVSSATSLKQDVPTKIKKTISWDKDLTIRYLTISYQDSPNEDIQEYRQVCIDQDEVRLKLHPITYIMTSLASIDASLKEFFFKVYFSVPSGCKHNSTGRNIVG